MISALMVDVDGVLVGGRPRDGRPWASGIEDDFGFSVEQLQLEFFAPYWNNIIVGRSTLDRYLKPVLAEIAPHLRYEDFVAYWFENDARLNNDLLEQLDQQRRSGRRVYLATNQEHARAAHLMEVLGLGSRCDGIYYSAALGCRKPDKAFFDKVSALSGFQTDQLLLIDDTPANVTAAQASGWNAIIWSDGCTLEAAMRNFDP